MIDEHCAPPLANAPPFAAIRGALFRDAALRSIDLALSAAGNIGPTYDVMLQTLLGRFP